MVRTFFLTLLVSFGLVGARDAFARPWASELFCQAYPQSPLCSGSRISCSFCHNGQPPSLNAFGGALKQSMEYQRISFPRSADEMESLIDSVTASDPDGDGFDNKKEITFGTLPGDPRSKPDGRICDKDKSQASSCEIDFDYVYKKIWLDFCREPAGYDDYVKFRRLSVQEKQQELDDQLDKCMESHNWRGKDGVVWEIGHYKIRPVGSVKAGDDAGIIPLVDYYADYNLFVYTQIDGHDAREVLLADYMVSRDESDPSRVVYTKLTPQRLVDGQIMQPDRRVGLLTTFWNLSFYLNYTGIARVLVAQAFNAYLGISLAQMQGLNEPDPSLSQFKDYDGKGVTRPECAQCHRTIDPLTYPFRNYNGLTGTLRVLQGQNATPLQNIENLGNEKNLTPLSYSLPRMDYLDEQYPGIKEMPESGYIFGQPVKNLREWAMVLVNSEMFAANTVKDYWRTMMGHNPGGYEQREYEQLWRDFMTKHDYSVKAMLHDLIRTEAYRVP